MNYDQDRLVTVREAAERLSIREGTIRLWLVQRRLPSVRCGRCVRVPLKALQEFVRQNTVPAREDQ
jgi:excisionase family DNA binding protein